MRQCGKRKKSFSNAHRIGVGGGTLSVLPDKHFPLNSKMGFTILQVRKNGN